MNEELKLIYDEDQDDRKNLDKALIREELAERDRKRRESVRKMVEDDLFQDGMDYVHAAMIFQHGEVPEDYLIATDLAKRAVELGEQRGLWMIAASTDRYLTNTKAPFQRYGTQYMRDEEGGKWYLYPVDPSTTDEDRAKYNVPPMERILEIEKELNEN